MLTSIKGIYDNGQILLAEEPTTTKSEVIVTFLQSETPKLQRKLGGLEGKVILPENFNEPLQDLKDYM